MKLIRKIIAVCTFSTLLVSCGGGEDSIPQNISSQNNVNSAWENALVYRPNNPIPIRLKDLGYHPPSPVAISMHGCAGISGNPFNENESYMPVLLAMQGYLVIEPNSYFGLKQGEPGSLLCYQIKGQWYIPDPNLSGSLRALDLEYAIAMVLKSSFWDKKTFLVEGHSQGAYLNLFTKSHRTIGPTKWLLSGYSHCQHFYSFTNNQPTLVINSIDSPFNEVVSQDCYDAIEKVHPNVKFKVLNSDKHSPWHDPEGLRIIKEWVKLQ